MKRITVATVRAIIKNGGATITREGVRVALRSGYQVSKQDLYILPVADFCKYHITTALSLLSRRGEYVGVWIDNGLAYIDISCRVSTKYEAMTLGKSLNQLSILRWRDGECIAVE